jgi:hypothetical protein
MPTRIDPTTDNPEPMVPCGGQWCRAADGGLDPLDAETAGAAGLDWPAPTATDTTPVTTKGARHGTSRS